MTESNSKQGAGNTWDRQINDSGEFVRKATTFRDWVRADGSSPYPAEAGRYHLYVSYACPWAHRTLITRALKGLENVISFDVVDHLLGSEGWTFRKQLDGATGDSVHGFDLLRQVYTKSAPDFDGTVTVPVLYDKQTGRIVNNESAEIIRMLNSEFQQLAGNPELDLYPEDLREQIDALNDWIYPKINNGVYRAGFAQKQAAYSAAVKSVFEGLEEVERILSESRYLCGDRFTEADVRLVTTLMRFDPVYLTHFRCNIRRLVEFPGTWAYTREIYQMPGVAETVNLAHIKHHYFESHRHINPFGIVPEGPALDFEEPHGRDLAG